VVLQFDLNRDIDGAARDVEAAIQAARVDLPSSLRSNPGYRKLNPSDARHDSGADLDTLTAGQIYDSASTILQQKLLQVQGIGDVTIGGSSLPAVRVELNPRALFQYGIGLEDVRAALSAANANSPKGAVDFGNQRYQIYVNDTATRAAQYQSLIVAYRNNAGVRLQDVARSDAVENIRNLGLADGQPAVLLVLHRQPGANVIDVVDRIRALIPELQASIPASIRIIQTNDRTETIRASLARCRAYAADRHRAGGAGGIHHPAQRAGRHGAERCGTAVAHRYLRRDVSAGFQSGQPVADGIDGRDRVRGRRCDRGAGEYFAPRRGTACRASMPRCTGAREVGFTVLAMSLSLIAVFLPILLMGGIVGRTFREFALTLSVAIIISLIVSLTTTPMMCAHVLDAGPTNRVGS
jgi:multidrug efflux pump